MTKRKNLEEEGFLYITRIQQSFFIEHANYSPYIRANMLGNNILKILRPLLSVKTTLRIL